MPNHVTNKVQIIGTPEQVKEVFDAVKSPEGTPEDEVRLFDFNQIIPMPASMNITSGSQVDLAVAVITNNVGEFREYLGYPAWVTACEEKGFPATLEGMKEYCKSRLSEKDYEEGRMHINNIATYGVANWHEWSRRYWGTKWNAYHFEEVDETTIKFDTAWSTPEEIFQALSIKFPKVKVSVEYADEDFGHNVGRYTYQAGVRLHFDEFSGSPEGLVLAEEVKGYNPRDEDEEE